MKVAAAVVAAVLLCGCENQRNADRVSEIKQGLTDLQARADDLKKQADALRGGKDPLDGKSDWYINFPTDPIDDSKAVVLLRSGHVIEGSGDDPDLVIRCRKKKTDVFIVGAMPDYSYENGVRVDVRLNDAVATREYWNVLASRDGIMVGDGRSMAFDLVQSKKLRTRYEGARGRPVSYEFEVGDLKNRLLTSGDNCGWKKLAGGTK